jgi:hypothetical protein
MAAGLAGNNSFFWKNFRDKIYWLASFAKVVASPLFVSASLRAASPK